MLKIRLSKVGKRGDRNFRIIVNDERRAVRSGKYIEKLGFYNPSLKKESFNKERILYWLSKGAKASATVHNLLIKSKIIAGQKIKKHKIKKSKEEKDERHPEAKIVPVAPKQQDKKE